MYAVIEEGRQFRVEQGLVVDMDLVEGKEVVFKKVLFFHDGTKIHVGAPYVPSCEVHGEVLGEVKGDKVVAYKYKQRKKSRRLVGHRQRYSRVRITKIVQGK